MTQPPPHPQIVDIADIGYDAWVPLWQAYLAFYRTSLPDEQYRLTWARLTGRERAQGARTPAGFAALVDGTPVGITHFHYHDHCWKAAQTCYLQDLYVDPSARGTGLGRALIAAVARQAEADGIDGVYWMTQSFNTPGRVLYDRVATLTPFVKYQADPTRL